MTTVNLILQGKGGVGKSVAASLLAQHYQSKGVNPICIDTDPVNPTFSAYKKLQVQPLNILNDEREINIRAFDELIDKIVSAKNQPIVVDNGAASFVPLMSYLIQNDILDLLKSMDHDIVIHSIITGGQAFLDTLSGFTQAAKNFPDPASFIVWENPIAGDVQSEKGIPFDKTKGFLEVQERVESIIRLPKLNAALAGKDFSEMLKSRKTFNEIIQDDSTSIMSRHRLKAVQNQINQQLDQSLLLQKKEGKNDTR